MKSILKISEAASIAIHTMFILAKNKNKQFTTKEIAEKINVSENHLSKVLQRLTREKLIVSNRGPKGGFIINNDSDSITLLDIYEAIDGKLELTDCLLSSPICNNNCVLGTLISSVNNTVKDYFEKTKLSDFVN